MDRQEPQPGDIVGEKYRVESVIGRGGMGMVCAARHSLTGKQVALKWMLPGMEGHDELVERFTREARAAGRIHSPNVVDIHDVLEDGKALVLVMELLRGESLTDVLLSRRLSRAELLAVLVGAMRGVAAAHAAGVIHRDLKPDNIFVQEAQPGIPHIPKVLDFGVSKLAAQEGEDLTKITKSGAVIGTPFYMSPEQARGDTTIDRRSDIYSFGVVLYEALTGQVPFNADGFGALLMEILTQDPPRPTALVPDIPPSLERVVLKAMARDPSDRYQTMEELIEAVEGYEDRASDDAGLPSSSTRVSVTPLTAEVEASIHAPARRSRLMVLGAGGGLVALVGAWAVLGSSTPTHPVNVVQPAAAPPAMVEPAADQGAPEPPPPTGVAPTEPDAGAAEGPAETPPARSRAAAKPKPSLAGAVRSGKAPTTEAPSATTGEPRAPTERATPRKPRKAPTVKGRSGGVSRDEF